MPYAESIAGLDHANFRVDLQHLANFTVFLQIR